MSIITKLEKHLKQFNSAPFLFIGSGFSRRYLGLEDWEGLLRKFAEELEKDFDYYISVGNGNWDKVAEAMAEDYHTIWWNKEKYKPSREEFKGKIINKFSPLKIEVAKYLRTKHNGNFPTKALEREVEQFKKIVVDGVITTNWDLFLEKLFANEYETFIGQEELLFSNPKQMAEIYKIHGCCTKPNSLILTHDDYKDFRNKNAYLASKLMTIFVEHPIIFIGYSMSDENIIEILTAITSCLSQENLLKLKDRLIFLQRDANNEGDLFQAIPMVLKNTTISVSSIRTNDFGKVYKVLSHNRRKFPAKMLRQMKSQIYELVHTNDPNGQLYAIDYDSDKSDIDLSKLEVVFGLGISNKLSVIGYKSISDQELFEDILLGNKNFDYEKIVTESLPELLKQNRYLPVYKFVVNSGVPFQELDSKIVQNLELTHGSFITRTLEDKKDYVQQNFKSIDDLFEAFYDEYGIQRVLEYTTLLDFEALDPEDLRKFIIENIELLKTGKMSNKTGIRKLIRMYDWIKY